MNIAFGVLFFCFFYIISYPFAKNFQLLGYSIKDYFKKMLALPYDFGGKNSLVLTRRMVRLAICYFITLAAVTITYFALLNSFWWILLGVVLEIFLLQLIFIFSALIIAPIEKFIKFCYKKRTISALNRFTGIKIGITGSFGKTSTKNFLAAMLSKKYKVCSSPKNFNTPMGLSKTVLENLRPEHEVLIMEMGARKSGDIAEMMNMLHPDYGIITAIGEQHLETFGSLENIVATKGEMCAHMHKDGTVIFDGYNEHSLSLYKKFAGTKYRTGNEGGLCFVNSIKCSSLGSFLKFNLDGRECKVRTKILGSELINDICLAALTAYILGVEIEDILSTIKSLSPAPHRLELIQNEFCSIIDDSYNSNLSGALQACETLALFKGKKIVVTPGLVEQGVKQYEFNFKLGKIIGAASDELIIMNEVNKIALTKGALAAGLNKEHIHYAQSRTQQKDLLKKLQQKGSVILFENDLPDNFR